jgi:thiol:disulfide interchange protein
MHCNRSAANSVVVGPRNVSIGMNAMHARPLRTLAVAAGLALCLASALIAQAADAQTAAAKPVKKDSPARAKSKEVSFKTSVEPAKAKAGDTVTYKVTATINDGYHIFRQAKKQPGNGPIYTEFDLFDTAGLKVEGDWNSSAPPEKHKLAVFASLPFVEYHEGEVVWSVKLKIPPGTEPGKKSIRSQIYYQVCSDKTCSIPGRWTLEAATLTVEAGGLAAASPATAVPAGFIDNYLAFEPHVPAQQVVAANAEPSAPTSVAATPAAEPTISEKAAVADVASTSAAIKVEPARLQTDVDRELERGLGPFLLFAAAGGLFALAMPCVWPMIPITVNFFVKQSQRDRKSAVGLAFAYCFSIIGVFTLVGVLFAFAFGASSLSALANNRWLNLGVAALFIVFGLSLLGLFEIRLPNFLVNATSKGEGKGGLIGVMFMALTLTITSFTCTFPVVGGLLVMASRGSLMYPVIGLATFASVIALPFFVLALAPGLLSKVPKSGNWMNSVKVVGGLVEIGAALKFLNAAEVASVVPSDAFFNASVVLTAWIVLSAVCGLYLLGLFKTDHDYGDEGVGPGRIVLGVVFLTLALYFSPALFGNPPKGRLWYTAVGLLPADVGDLARPMLAAGGAAGETGHAAATSADPKVAVTQEKAFHGVAWGMSYEAALEQAKASGKPVLIDFTGVNCANCRQMEQEVLIRPEVIELLAKFVPVQLYTDFVPIKSISAEARDDLGRENLEREIDLTDQAVNPLYVVIGPDGKTVSVRGGYVPSSEFVGFLKDSLDKAAGATAVAIAGE